MLTFPALKTGAIAQYPLATTTAFANEVLQFIAGDEQRYPTSGTPLRRWKLQLDLLDEGELNSVKMFFDGVFGSYQVFSFTDPASGISFQNCRFSMDTLAHAFSAELRSSVAITIEEGRD